MANTGNGIVFLILAFLLLLFVDFQSHYQLWGKKPSTNSEDITATAPSILDLQAQIYEARIIIPLADLFLRVFLVFFFPGPF